LTSCVDEIQLSSNTEEQKLVFHCELSQGEGVLAQVSESIVVGSLNQFDQIKDAELVLSDSGQESLGFIFDEESQKYEIKNLVIEEGKTYTINGSLPNSEVLDIEAQQTVPVGQELIGRELIAVDLENKTYTFRLEFDQTAAIDLYQIIPRANVYTFTGSGVNKVYSHSSKSYSFELTENQIFNGALHDLHHKEGFLVDRNLLESNSVEITFKYNDDDLASNEELRFLNIEVRTTSNSYFRYHKAVSKQLKSGKGLSFSEPSLSYTNIDNGYGFFGAYGLRIDSLLLN